MESLNIFDSDCIKLLHDNNLLSQLISNELIKKKISEVSLDEENIQKLKNQFYKENSIQDENDLKKILEKSGTTEDKFIDKLTLNPRVNIYCLNNYSSKVKSLFLERKDSLDQVIYSLIRTQDHFNARELHLRIEEDEANFGDLSHEFSEGPEKLTRGIVGPAPITQAHPIIAEFIRAGKVGDLSQVFRIEQFSIIIRIESVQKAKLDENMTLQLSRELFENDLKKESQVILDAMLKK